MPRTADQGAIPDDPCSNYTYVLGYTGSQLTQVDKSKDGLTWRKILTWTGSNLTAVGPWIRL